MDGPKSLNYYLKLYGRIHIPPSGTRCHKREQRAMLQYVDSWPAHWRNTITSLADTLPAMSPRTRIVGLVPARNEEHRIRAFLKAILNDVYSSQMESSCELIILENGLPMEIGPTGSAIETWIKESHPHFPVHILKHTWDEAEASPLAKGRKLLADVAVFRACKFSPRQSFYLLSEDADTISIQTGRLRGALSLLDRFPVVDAIRGRQERSLWAMNCNHLALLERRSWQFTELLLSSRRYWPDKNTHHNFYWHRVVTAGSNVFFSAEVYSLIGGYSDDVSVFEDMDIGQRISVLRGHYAGARFIPRLDTICRFPFRQESCIARVLLSLVRKGHLYGHDGAGFYGVDHIIKRPDSVALLLQKLAPHAQPHQNNIHRYEEVLKDLYIEILRIFEGRGEGVKLFRRVMMYLGFKNNAYACTDSGDICLLAYPVFSRPFQAE